MSFKVMNSNASGMGCPSRSGVGHVPPFTVGGVCACPHVCVQTEVRGQLCWGSVLFFLWAPGPELCLPGLHSHLLYLLPYLPSLVLIFFEC